MTRLRTLVAGVGLAALATSAFAQSPSTDEISALRAQVQALSARLEQLEAQAAAQQAPAAPAAAGTRPRPPRVL